MARIASACGPVSVRVAAVALLHGYRNPTHERQLKDWLLGQGFDEVSCSAELAPRIKLFPRAETTVVDACLAPVVRGYLERVRSRVPGELLVMTSAGGLLDPESFRPKDSLFSGPTRRRPTGFCRGVAPASRSDTTAPEAGWSWRLPPRGHGALARSARTDSIGPRSAAAMTCCPRVVG